MYDADIVIALLDGSQADGTAREIGYFCAKKNHPNRKLSESGLISAEQGR